MPRSGGKPAAGHRQPAAPAKRKRGKSWGGGRGKAAPESRSGQGGTPRQPQRTAPVLSWAAARSGPEAENGRLERDTADLQERLRTEREEQKNTEHRRCGGVGRICRAHRQKPMPYDGRLKRTVTCFPHVREPVPAAGPCRETGLPVCALSV